MKKRNLTLLLLTAFALEATLFGLQHSTINKSRDNLALSGYDAVSYFKDKKPTEGKAEFTFQWMDATWRFASTENRDAFAKEPEKYAPQYGGYCAFGASQGHLVPGDPQAWRVVDSKLYLNYNKEVQQYWLQDVPGNIQKADRNWPKLQK